MIRLVVNAEEFGSTAATSSRIARAHREGIVTSTSLAGNCVDFAGACAALADMPEMGVGLALALVGGQPVARPDDVPSLMTAAGALRNRAIDFAVDWWRKAITPDHLERELDAQIARALAAGIPVDHLCTRAHLGFLPGVGLIIERLARRHRIAGIRSTVEPPTLAWVADPRRALEIGVLGGLSWLTRRRLGPLRHGPQSWGYLEAGRLDEVRIMEIVGRLAPGSHELICHPGGDGPEVDGAVGAPHPSDQAREHQGSTASTSSAGTAVNGESGEFRALMSPKVKDALRRRGIVLCRWRDLF
jgi:hypothetical protein